MRRVLSLWFPTFATDLVKRRRSVSPADVRAAHPLPLLVLLTREVAGRELVARCCEIAAKAGISEGMDLAHARSLVPPRVAVHTEPHRPDRDAQALHALTCRLLKLSPLVAPDPPDGIIIDITGTELVHRGEIRVIRSAARGLRKLDLRVRIAAASTFACAWGVARFADLPLTVIASGSEREAMVPLPVAALRIDLETQVALCEVGIERVEHVLALPRSSLASRFGIEILDRLNKMLGITPERLDPVCPLPPLQASMLFEGPTDQWESVEAAVKIVLEDLCTQLTSRERGVRRLEIELRRPDSLSDVIVIPLSRPSRSFKHLWSLVRSKLERTDLSKGVEGVLLFARRTARVRHEQINSPSLGGSTEQVAQASWGELVDTLVDRLGPNSVTRIEPVESHLPEHAWRERSILEEFTRTPASITPADRPTRLFSPPEPAEAIALVPDGPVFSLGWRNKQWQVLACAGPERLGPEWWRWSIEPPDRDYFALQLETGLWIWACRQTKNRRWFVHGEWS
ncbi:MAG: Y-family DNA polymerase [Phycisphaerales bacterium]